MPPLRALVEAGHDIRLVVTRPDRRRSRRGEPEPSPVKRAAEELGLRVSHTVDDVLDTGAERGVVVAFGRLIRPHVLERVPMVNLHFSLLPRWRGAAPVERAILAGDTETGVCLMELEEGLDTGPVYVMERVAIEPTDTAEELRARLVEVGTRLLVDALERGLGTPTPQAGEVTHADKITAEEMRLAWDRPADELSRVVRAGRAWTTFRGKRLLVTRAEPDEVDGLDPGEIDGARIGAGEGTALRLHEVKPEGRAVQPAADWVRGARPTPGERLGP